MAEAGHVTLCVQVGLHLWSGMMQGPSMGRVTHSSGRECPDNLGAIILIPACLLALQLLLQFYDP